MGNVEELTYFNWFSLDDTPKCIVHCTTYSVHDIGDGDGEGGVGGREGGREGAR